MKKIGMTRGVVIAMNPQTGEILAMVSLPTYDNNLFARGISAADLREAAQEQGQAAAQPRDPGALRPGIDLQARRRHRRRSPTARSPPSTRVHDEGLPDARRHEVLRVEPPRLGSAATSTAGSGTRATRSSTSSPACSGSTGSATGRSSTASASRPASTCPSEVAGIVPTNAWKQDALGAEMFPGETYQAGIGQGYDAVTPLQLINAYAALANGGTLYQPQIVREIIGPDGDGRPPVRAQGPPQDEGHAERPADRCATPPARP